MFFLLPLAGAAFGTWVNYGEKRDRNRWTPLKMVWGAILGFWVVGFFTLLLGTSVVNTGNDPLLAMEGGHYVTYNGQDSWTYRLGDVNYETVPELRIIETTDSPYVERTRECITALPWWTVCTGAGDETIVYVPKDSLRTGN